MVFEIADFGAWCKPEHLQAQQGGEIWLLFRVEIAAAPGHGSWRWPPAPAPPDAARSRRRAASRRTHRGPPPQRGPQSREISRHVGASLPLGASQDDPGLIGSRTGLGIGADQHLRVTQLRASQQERRVLALVRPLARADQETRMRSHPVEIGVQGLDQPVSGAVERSPLGDYPVEPCQRSGREAASTARARIGTIFLLETTRARAPPRTPSTPRSRG